MYNPYMKQFTIGSHDLVGCSHELIFVVGLEGFPEDLEHFGGEQVSPCINDTADIRLWFLNIVQNLCGTKYGKWNMWNRE